MVIIFIGFNSIFITIEQGQNLDQSQCRVSKHINLWQGKQQRGALEIDKYKKGDELVFDRNQIK